MTAASAGLGRSLVELILKGGDIAVATLRTPSALDNLKEEYDENQLLLLPLDVTNIGQIKNAFQAATDKYGRIDFVYNLAGHGLIGEVEGTPEEVARAMFEVNFWGATRISNEAVRVFREVNEPRGGHLFVITSLVGLKAMAGTGFYAATKHGQACLCSYHALVDHPYSVGRCYRGPKYGTPPILGYQGTISCSSHSSPAKPRNRSQSSSRGASEPKPSRKTSRSWHLTRLTRTLASHPNSCGISCQ